MRVLLLCGLVLVGTIWAEEKKDVIFEYEDASATAVAVVGEFSQGRPIPMARDPHGIWSCRVSLSPGEYAYKFFVNGRTMEFDPKNGARKRLNNFEYSVLTVGESTPVVPPPVATQPPVAPPRPPAVATPPKIGKPMIAIEVVPTKGTRKLSSNAYDDDRSQNVQLTVIVKNREMNREHKGLTGELYVLARGTQDNREYQVIIHESKTFDLQSLETVEYKSDTAKLQYDERGSRWGFKYYGYLYILRDANNNVVLMQGVPEKLVDSVEKFHDQELNDTFNM